MHNWHSFKKAKVSFLLFAIAFTLCGCSMRDMLIRQSGIDSDPDYEQYQIMSEKNMLDENGHYQNGSVKITLSNNTDIDVSYFRDAELSDEITDDWCFMNPGDSIYTSEAVTKSGSNKYVFSTFRISTIVDGNEKELVTEVEQCGSLLYTIPEYFENRELIIEPLGIYQDRELSLNDYWIDKDSTEKSIGGNWEIDGDQYQAGLVKVSPVKSYSVTYKYDTDKYFLVKTYPEFWYCDESKGTVEFPIADTQNEQVYYSVELHPYIQAELRIKDNKIIQIAKNGDPVDYKGEYGILISNLKYGDSVTVVTSEKDVFTCEQLTVKSTEETDSGYLYTLYVRDPRGDFRFDPSAFYFSHGKLKFTCEGTEITEETYLNTGMVLHYEAVEVEDGFWLPDGDHQIIIDDISTEEQIRNIRFYPYKQVTVSLPQPDAGGSISYSYTDKPDEPITDNLITVYCGTKLSMSFSAWSGWIKNYDDGCTYTVGTEAFQTINISGGKVDSAFSENEGHKPNLSVILDPSVGEDLTVQITGSGFTVYDAQYTGTDLYIVHVGSDTLFQGSIGTDKPIKTKFSNDSLEEGKAIKLVYECESTAGKTTEIRYIREIPTEEEYLIYDNRSVSSSIVFKTIKMTISIADVVLYKPITYEGATISVTLNDTGKTPCDGDYLENNRSISLVITPDTGYRMIGKNIDDNTYSKVIRYSQLEETISSVLAAQLKKEYTIDLVQHDDHGNVEFFVDGKKITEESVTVYEGQSLKIRYTLTDTGYDFVDEKKLLGFVPIIINKDTREYTISVTSDLDRSAIQADRYIMLVQKEETE